jgi:hypothetical protein
MSYLFFPSTVTILPRYTLYDVINFNITIFRILLLVPKMLLLQLNLARRKNTQKSTCFMHRLTRDFKVRNLVSVQPHAKGRASILYTVSLYTPHVQGALRMKHKGTYK